MKSDIFELLEPSRLPEPGQASLPIISLWWSGTYYLMFFTLHPETFASHYEKGSGNYRCLGDGCCACAVGLRPTEHVYLPVWDAQCRRIAILKFDTRPDGPAAKILVFLHAYKDQLANVVAVVDCQGYGNFTITAHAPKPETDRGAIACQEFCRDLEAGVISVHSCVQQLSPEAIMKLPSVGCRTTQVVGEAVAPASLTSLAMDAPVVPPTNEEA